MREIKKKFIDNILFVYFLVILQKNNYTTTEFAFDIFFKLKKNL